MSLTESSNADLLLTIALPIYNRSQELDFLLTSVEKEIRVIGDHMEIIELLVIDNNSTDNIEGIIEKWERKLGRIKFIKNTSNIGATGNFIKCLSEAKGDYVWIIGDDALEQNILKVLIPFLQNYKPDMVYVKAKWISRVLVEKDLLRSRKFKIREASPRELIMYANSQLTFTPSIVFSKKEYGLYKGESDTNFPQLNWVGYFLNRTSKLVIINGGIIARGGVSGGYNLIETFSKDLMNSVEECFTNKKGKKLFIQLFLLITLPSFINSLLGGKLGNFKSLSRDIRKMNFNLLVNAYSNKVIFWLFIYPFFRFNKFVYKPIFWFNRIIVKILRLLRIIG